MALLYSRDASAGPIRKLEECLAEIRAKSFVPDATRSGYFPMQAQRPDPDVEQGLSGRGSHEHDRATDFSDSDSEDSRDDEHAFEEQLLNEEAMDHVVGPWDEHATLESLGLHEDAPLFRNRFTRYIHLLAEEGGNKFRCGREVNCKYEELERRPKFMSPQCSQCFRDVAS